jgi:dynein light chain LC8-type
MADQTDEAKTPDTAQNFNFVYSEMSEEDQKTTVDLCIEALKLQDKSDTTVHQKTIAETVKKELDTQKGGTWNVIVGQSFGSFVSHETKTITHFYIGNVGFLIWRHG